jgi:hypothetical protein
MVNSVRGISELHLENHPSLVNMEESVLTDLSSMCDLIFRANINPHVVCRINPPRRSTILRLLTLGEHLGLVEGRTPFVAESLPDARVAVWVNEEILQKVASHILMRAGYILMIDK